MMRSRGNSAGAVLAPAVALWLAGAGALAAADGAQVFADVCAACHGEAGVGTPGLAPPLQDPALWQRLGDRAPDYIGAVVVSGLSGNLTVQGMGYYGLVMPPQTDLGDAELAAVTSYVLGTLAGLDASLTEADIAAHRAAPQPHKALMALRGGGT